MGRLIGYVRVSRVGGREGESFGSPQIQKERIEQVARSLGHIVTDWHSDMDESGGRYERRGLQAAIEAVERGDADGIAVARLNRFARSTAGAAKALERIEAARGFLVAGDLGLDTSTPVGKAMRNMMMVLAELELEQIREQSHLNRQRTIARGVHISRVPPVGYKRGPDGRLVPDPGAAPIVREVYRKRAAGATWDELCEFLDVRLPRESGSWTRQTVASLIQRRTYLGEAFSGDMVNRDAHEPLVGRTEWEAAQSVSRRLPTRIAGALLAGLLRCAGCGQPMTRQSDGARGYANYRCRVRHSSGVCSEPARISVRRADEFVESEFLAWLDREGIAAAGVPEDGVVEVAVARLENAEAELRTYRDLNLASVLGDAFRDGLVQRAEAVNAARRALLDAQRGAPLTQPVQTLLVVWPELTTPERRKILAGAIDAVFVRRAHLPGKGSPAAGRTHILWRSEGNVDLLARGSFGRFGFPDDFQTPDVVGVAGA